MNENKNRNLSWQDSMFNELADEFIEVLEAKPLPSDVGLFLESLRSDTRNRFAILDIACGIGRMFPHLSKAGTVVVGLDYYPKLIVEAAKRASLLPNVSVVCHDMRNLRKLFPCRSFNLVVRAYTSLGYFPPETEADILTQCHDLVVPGGKLVVDTFNSEWFRTVRSSRTVKKQFGSFEVEEEYHWDAELCLIRCMWRYNLSTAEKREIRFTLDGYDIAAIDKLLFQTGWKREGLFEDLSISSRGVDSSKMERCVVVAGRVD